MLYAAKKMPQNTQILSNLNSLLPASLDKALMYIVKRPLETLIGQNTAWKRSIYSAFVSFPWVETFDINTQHNISLDSKSAIQSTQVQSQLSSDWHSPNWKTGAQGPRITILSDHPSYYPCT